MVLHQVQNLAEVVMVSGRSGRVLNLVVKESGQDIRQVVDARVRRRQRRELVPVLLLQIGVAVIERLFVLGNLEVLRYGRAVDGEGRWIRVALDVAASRLHRRLVRVMIRMRCGAADIGRRLCRVMLHRWRLSGGHVIGGGGDLVVARKRRRAAIGGRLAVRKMVIAFVDVDLGRRGCVRHRVGVVHHWHRSRVRVDDRPPG